MEKIIELLATWFYLGRAQKAPGTIGTLGAIPFVVVLYITGPLSYMGITLLFTLAAIYISQMYEVKLGVHDSKQIVIDEVAGFFIAMTWLPLTWKYMLAAFVLFRFFDILKPFPINVLDRKVKGGLGVVLDDVAAGLVTNIILQVVYTKTTWLM